MAETGGLSPPASPKSPRLRRLIEKLPLRLKGKLPAGNDPFLSSRQPLLSLPATVKESAEWQRTIDTAKRSVVVIHSYRPCPFNGAHPHTVEATGFIVNLEER